MAASKKKKQINILTYYYTAAARFMLAEHQVLGIEYDCPYIIKMGEALRLTGDKMIWNHSFSLSILLASCVHQSRTFLEDILY